jgi:hypothetical protein
VRWYITYRLSYRDLVAMVAERGVIISHMTIVRWVIRYVPEFEKRWNRFGRSIGGSWRRVQRNSPCNGLDGHIRQWNARAALPFSFSILPFPLFLTLSGVE